MNEHVNEARNSAGSIIAFVILFSIGYAIVRYHVVGPVPWKEFPFFILNKGIALAVSRSGLLPVQATPVLTQIQRNYHPSRSGDIYVVQEPYWFMFEKGPIAAAISALMR